MVGIDGQVDPVVLFKDAILVAPIKGCKVYTK